MLLLCYLNSSDWINVSGIAVNAILGIAIALIIKRISNKRAIKDYFMNEIKNIREDYRKFLIDLFGGKFTFNSTNNWFQVMNMRLINLEETLKNIHKISNFGAKDLNHDLRDIITNHQDFNDAFNKSSVTISQLHKQEIVKKQAEISKSLMDTIIDINNS